MRASIFTAIVSCAVASGASVASLALARSFVPLAYSSSAYSPCCVPDKTMAVIWALPLLIALSFFYAIPGFVFGRRKLALLISCIPLFAFICVLLAAPEPTEEDLIFEARYRPVTFTGKVLESLDDRKALVAPIQLLGRRRTALSGRTIVFFSQPSGRLQEGTLRTFRVRVRAPQGKLVRWDYDYRFHLYRKGVFSVCYEVAEESSVGDWNRATAGSRQSGYEHLSANTESDSWLSSLIGSWERLWNRFRQLILAVHRDNLGARRGDLLSAMVLGERTVKLDSEIVEGFRDVGLSHLLAASGFNLSLVVASAYLFVGLISRLKLVKVLVSLLAVMAFVALAGPSPSVVRAAIMATLLLLLRLSRRRVNSGSALFATLLLAICVDPLSIADVGFQLSYVATGSIVFGIGALRCRGSAERLKSKCGGLVRKIFDTAVVILIAQMSVLPIQVMVFGQSGCIFLPANLLVDPVVAPVTVAGFVASVLSVLASFLGPFVVQIDQLVLLIDGVAAYGIDYMLSLVSCLSALQGELFDTGAPSLYGVFMYFACSISMLYLLRWKAFDALSIALMMFGTSCLLLRCHLPEPLMFISGKSIVLIDRNVCFIQGPGGYDERLDRRSRELIRFLAIRERRPLAMWNVLQERRSQPIQIVSMARSHSESGRSSNLSGQGLTIIVSPSAKRKSVCRYYESSNLISIFATSRDPILVKLPRNLSRSSRAHRLDSTFDRRFPLARILDPFETYDSVGVLKMVR